MESLKGKTHEERMKIFEAKKKRRILERRIKKIFITSLGIVFLFVGVSMLNKLTVKSEIVEVLESTTVEVIPAEITFDKEVSATPIPTNAPTPIPTITITIEEEIEESIPESNQYTYDAMHVTAEEIWYFEQVVMAECYSYFTEEEMLYIASVIRNRIEASCYPNDVIGVVTQKNQFEVYGNKRYLEVIPNEQCKAAVNRALQGDTNLPEDIMFFCTVEYYNNASETTFFKTNVINVPEYNFRNVMMFRAK